MKRMIAILLAVLALTGILTGCSGTAYYDDGMGYGNVSTTPNGRVNGGASNAPMGGIFEDGGRGNYGGTYGRNSGSNAMGGGSNGSSRQGGSTANSGTGMTGGR